MQLPLKGETVTFARANFDFALRDVARLLQLHDAGVRERRGPPNPDLEVFKRAGVILAVTAWESFIEDTLTAALKERLDAAKSPNEVSRAFNAVAHSWLSQNPRPPDLVDWTGDTWKSMLRKHAAREIADLNTPKSAKIAQLSRRYLARDVTTHWYWPGTRVRTARERLDQLIRLRGMLVHRTKEFSERRASVKRRDVARAIALITRLVQRTEEALGREPKKLSFSAE